MRDARSASRQSTKKLEKEVSNMKRWTLLALVLLSVMALAAAIYRSTNSRGATSANAQTFQAVEQSDNSITETTSLDGARVEAREFAIVRYRLDASQSRFMVH